MTHKRNKLGRFSCNIKNGNLYLFKGMPVKAVKKNGKGRRMVSFHGMLFGTVKEDTLSAVS